MRQSLIKIENEKLEKYEKQVFVSAFILFIMLPFTQSAIHEFGHIIIGYLLSGSVDVIQLNFFGVSRVCINNLDEIGMIVTGFAGNIFESFLFIVLGKIYKRYLLLVPICLIGSMFEGFISFIGRELHYITANIIFFLSMLFIPLMIYEKLKFAVEIET